jgi:hypothetical protein
MMKQLLFVTLFCAAVLGVNSLSAGCECPKDEAKKCECAKDVDTKKVEDTKAVAEAPKAEENKVEEKAINEEEFAKFSAALKKDAEAADVAKEKTEPAVQQPAQDIKQA